MMAATLVFGSPDWMAAAAGLVIAGVWLAVRSYPGASLSRGRGGRVPFLLKSVCLVLLALCVVEPLWSGVRPRAGANLFLVAVDNSKSMSIRDAGAEESRGDHVRRAVKNESAPWRIRLEQDFDARHYLFDRTLRGLDGGAALTFDGTATNIWSTLREIQERFSGRPVAGVMLFTDGRSTDPPPDGFDFSRLPPIYPIDVAGNAPREDVAVSRVAVSQAEFEDAPVSIQADVVGPSGATPFEVRLFDDEGKLVESIVQSATSDQGPTAFRFQVRPTKPGVSFYEVRAARKGEFAAFDNPESSVEATLANNRRHVFVRRPSGKRRILYVGGRPNWDFKFLRRALEEDSLLELAAILRIAKREPKFDWRSRTGENTNPLFRGFEQEEKEDVERYDQPVLVRLGTKDANEFKDGFPKIRSELFGFHAVILDDIEAAFFTNDQMNLLEKFVSERGGGLLALGGQESLRQGEYNRTPIGKMLPVYLDRPPSGKSSAAYRFVLSREGWLQPWMRLRANEADERVRFSAMPEFMAVNRLDAIKPGAITLAELVNEQSERLPGLVVQRFGRGRSAVLAIADFYRWRLHLDSNNQDADKAWRQTIRWLVSDVPDPIDFQAEPDLSDPNQAVKLRVMVRDENFGPKEDATVSVKVSSPGGDAITLDAQPSSAEAGLYETTFVPRAAGSYRASATVADNTGRKYEPIESGWVSDPLADELADLSANRPLLADLAARTKGEVVAVADLDRFVKSLQGRQAPITERWTHPLWNSTWVYVILIGLLASEWGLRRWRGLA